MEMGASHCSPFLLLFLLLSSSWSSSSSASEVRRAPYHHLQLVYTWPNTFCMNKKVACKLPVPQNFVVHGLWPADRAGNCLVHCRKTESIYWALRKYERRLATSWQSLRRDFPNSQFWEHEWNKHGTCALPRIKAVQYLQLIIALRPRFDLLSALLKNNIIPNNSSYPREIVEAAISEETRGRNFYISCQSMRKNRVLINEIYVCFDGSGTKIVSCPASNRDKGCGRNMNLVFPGPDDGYVEYELV